MIVKSEFSNLILPAIRWLWFCANRYRQRRRNENGSRYYRNRRTAYQAWLDRIALD